MADPKNKTSTKVLKVWLDYGDALHLYPVKVAALARHLKVNRHIVRRAQKLVEAIGPPDKDTLKATHLIIPDAHAKPGVSTDRFAWLGREIEEVGREAIEQQRPFRVVSIGDFGDFHSLSHYDKGKKASWGSTYPADVVAVQDAVLRMRNNCSSEVWSYADKHWCEGNHEQRASRYMADNPELSGVLEDMYTAMSNAGFKTHPFLEFAVLDGVGYVHYMQSNNGRAVSGVNIARSLIMKGHRSIVVGHCHRFDTFTETDCYGNPIQALSCGCYFDHHEAYAGQSNSKWWRGICILRDVTDGHYNLETRTLSSLKSKYSGEES